jgi:hypothetical protein
MSKSWFSPSIALLYGQVYRGLLFSASATNIPMRQHRLDALRANTVSNVPTVREYKAVFTVSDGQTHFTCPELDVVVNAAMRTCCFFGGGRGH